MKHLLRFARARHFAREITKVFTSKQSNKPRERRSMAVRTCLKAWLVGSMSFVAYPASALTFGGEYMDSWSGCECSQTGLSQTGDQIHEWADALAAMGHTRAWVYANGDVWASDITEDRMSGEDNLYGDAVDLYAYSGHGDNSNDSSGWQTFKIPMCKKGSTSSCWFDANNARWGERAGGYQTPYAGRMRWALFLTCHSVDTDPLHQWSQAMEYGFDYVMGYNGLSADSHNTDEVAGDWANEAIGSGTAFKAAWFWAMEDWWVDDTGGVVASGTTQASANSRRDNLNKNTSRRPASEYHGYLAWSYHSG